MDATQTHARRVSKSSVNEIECEDLVGLMKYLFCGNAEYKGALFGYSVQGNF